MRDVVRLMLPVKTGSTPTFVKTAESAQEFGYQRSGRNRLLFVGVWSVIEGRDRSSMP